MKKYINADALIKEIELQAEDCDVIEFQLAGYGCANIVKDFPASDIREVMNSAWIPISVRLPEVDAECIISLDKFIDFATYTGEDFHAEWCDYEVTEVTAWMPKPETYKADKWGDYTYAGENIERGNGLP